MHPIPQGRGPYYLSKELMKMRKCKKASIRSALEDSVIIQDVLQETKTFSTLCNEYTLRAAASCRCQQLHYLREQIACSRVLLKQLAMHAESCRGAYNSVVAALRALAEAEIKGVR